MLYPSIILYHEIQRKEQENSVLKKCPYSKWGIDNIIYLLLSHYSNFMMHSIMFGAYQQSDLYSCPAVIKLARH